MKNRTLQERRMARAVWIVGRALVVGLIALYTYGLGLRHGVEQVEGEIREMLERVSVCVVEDA